MALKLPFWVIDHVSLVWGENPTGKVQLHQLMLGILEKVDPSRAEAVKVPAASLVHPRGHHQGWITNHTHTTKDRGASNHLAFPRRQRSLNATCISSPWAVGNLHLVWVDSSVWGQTDVAPEVKGVHYRMRTMVLYL